MTAVVLASRKPAAMDDPSAPARPPVRTAARRRWGIGVLLGSGILINDFDRINLSVAVPSLGHAFGLSAAQLGLLFSAFFGSYAVSQIPDRHDP